MLLIVSLHRYSEGDYLTSFSLRRVYHTHIYTALN